MAWQLTPFTIPLIIIAATSIVLAIYRLRYQQTPSSKIGAFLLLMVAGWVLAYALEQASLDLSSKFFLTKIKFVAICIAPTAWLIYTLQYTGYRSVITRYKVALLTVVPLITILLILTNEAHSLIWSHVELNIDDPFLVRYLSRGPGYWILVAYAYLVALAGIFLLIRALARSGRFDRWQAGVLLIVVFTLWLVNAALDVFRLIPFPYHFELTPIVIGLTAPLISWRLYRLQLWNVVPVARERLIESMDDGVMVLDVQNRIIDMNPAMERLVGQARSASMSQPVDQLWPEWAGQIKLAQEEAETGQEVVLGQGDESRIYDLHVSPLVDWRNQLVSRVVVLRDVTERVQMQQALQQAKDELEIEVAERKQAEEQVKASLKEKEVLLQEIHHRVKNNLQIISSLLNLQAGYVEDQQTLEIFHDSQNRIRSMALIHEKLYRSQNLARIELAEYIQTLATYLFRSHQANVRDIDLKLEVDHVFLEIDTAVPCGLILNELISNALKHAFPDGRPGQIRIVLRADDNASQLTLIVTDNGVGFPIDMDFYNTTSLGLQLVNTLVDQLDGIIELKNNPGTEFKITFPTSLKKDLAHG